MWPLLLVLVVSSYPCKFYLSDGSEYDLSKLIQDIPDYEIENFAFVFRFNICQDALKYCNGDTGIATQWDYNGGCVAVIGRQGPTLPILKKTEEGLVLSYFNGDFCGNIDRSVNYRLHCDPNSPKTRIGYIEETGRNGEDGGCTYSFDIYSKNACFGDETLTSDYWWVFYGVLLLVLAYFVLGWFYNKYQDKEIGSLEAIPHSEGIFEAFGKIFNKIRLSTR